MRFPARAWVTIALVVIVAWLLLAAGDLGRLARIVPVAVAWPVLFLLVFVLALDCFPAAAALVRRYEQLHFKRAESFMSRARNGEVVQTVAADSRTESIVISWVLALPAAVLLLGFPVGAGLFVFLHLRQRIGLRWWKATVGGCVTGTLLFFLSRHLLHTELYSGLFW